MTNVEQAPVAQPESSPARDREIGPAEIRAGLAAWLGWLFDGLDMHLFTLVATPFVAELLLAQGDDKALAPRYSSIIQASFLVGWALGGGFFGRIGDRLGRSRALVLTILTYALFTGLSYLATAWWHLLIFRFLAALGIGGEWAVGATLLAETWPRRWRPWLAAVLQSGVNIGVLLATAAAFLLASQEHRVVFLVGVLPAFLTLWIRRAVPEPEHWHQAHVSAASRAPSVAELFRGPVLRVTLLTMAVCALSLTAHWAFMYWGIQQFLALPESVVQGEAAKRKLASTAMALLMVGAIVGNFSASAVARRFGYRRSIAVFMVLYWALITGTYYTARSYGEMHLWLLALGAASGVFGLFTMYMPPLFPTLLRTTGAGFCYNIGRLAAAAGTVYFGLFAKVGDYRLTLMLAGCLFLPAAVVAWFLPELSDVDRN